MTNQLTDAGENLIKSFESCSLVAYQDVKGIWTQGWGHTSGISEDSTPTTQEQAEQWFEDDLEGAENAITNAIQVDLNDNQYSALVSLVFNCGAAPLTGHLGSHLNSGDFVSAAEAFLSWDHASIDGVEQVVPGLARRRQAEHDLFITAMD
jgi:lysozyme